MNLTNPQFNIANLAALNSTESHGNPLERTSSQPASSKRLEVTAVIEIAFAFAGVFVLLAIGAAIWHSAGFDWFESIRRFQEMI